MKYIQETTIYEFMNNGKEDLLNKHISEFLSKGMTVLNAEFEMELKTIKRNYADAISTKALAAVESGDIILGLANDPMISLPSYMPFIKFKRANKTSVAIDVTRYVKVTKQKSGPNTYSIDTNKLYCLITAGYLYLAVFDKTTVLSTALMTTSATVWARMFCKVLEMRVGLATNRDRYDAFMYLAMKFFLKSVIEAPEGICDSIARSYFPTKKPNAIASRTEMLAEERNIEMFKDLPTFCQTIFNNEFTGLNPLRVNGSKDVMNYSYYVAQYISLFYLPAVLSLECYPYFIWVVLSASNWGYFFNDKLIQELSKNEAPKMMVELFKMV